ncbi:MAG: hypothetical protein ACFB0Z_09895 [Candidatus Phaeomarinobacter sp.]
MANRIGRAPCAQMTNDVWQVFGSTRKERDAAAAQDALGEAFTLLAFDSWARSGLSLARSSATGQIGGEM